MQSTPPTPDEVLRLLEEQATRLASKNCSYMAATLLQYYDGAWAEETKAARLKAAQTYFDLSLQQCSPGAA